LRSVAATVRPSLAISMMDAAPISSTKEISRCVDSEKSLDCSAAISA
jgi:hypothetical protein